MIKLYHRDKLTFAITLIVIYCLTQSLANPLSDAVGIDSAFQALFNVVMTAVLLGFLGKHGLWEEYGFCRSKVPRRTLLWYLPLVVLSGNNLWFGTAVNMPLADTVCYLVCMLCVGFLEELIFRGFLFRAMARENVTAAIIVSSVTFGIGHLLNLVNGSGMALFENLCQVCGAIAIGFLFVTLFYRTGSLLPCIASHSAINMLSAFARESAITPGKHIASIAAVILLAAAYALYLTKVLPQGQLKE